MIYRDNYKRTVVCLKDYVEDDILYWSAGATYGAIKHKDGTWGIETNLGNEGGVGPGYMLDDFDMSFADTKHLTLLDAVKLAYNKGYFEVTDKDSYGCMGLHCETHSMNPNGFYCFGEFAEGFPGTPEEFIEEMGEEDICKDITETIMDMIKNEPFQEEAYIYLLDIKSLCEYKGTNVFQPVLLQWMENEKDLADIER